MASYTYNDVLTRASTTIQVIEDVAIYKAQLFSTNGNIFSQRDTESELSVKVFKGLEDITNRFTDIVWKRFTTSGDNITEDNNWGQQHVNKKNITITRDDINEKANIQVEVYTSIDGERKLAASDFISFIDVNDMDGSPTPPSSPKDGDLWLDTSVMPPRLMVWDSKLGKWIEVAMAGRDRRNLLRNSNFFKKSTEYWTKVGNPTIEIESTNGKKWARIKSTSQNGYYGISQIVHATSKAQYSFQLLSEIYIQSAYPNGNIVVVFNSINSQGTKTLIKESNYDITENPKVFTDTFMSLDDTAKIEVIISGQKNADFDFVVTDTKLENYPTPTAWELAVEDMQEALNDKVGNSAEEVFNSLTDDGKMQGIYVDVDEHGQKNYYFNGRYVDAKNLKVTNNHGTTTLHIDEDGNVALNVSSFTLTVGADTNVPTKHEVNNQIDNIQIGGTNLISDTRDVFRRTEAMPTYDKETHTWTITIANNEDNTWGAGLRIGGRNVRIPYGKTFILSFEIFVPVACQWSVDINNYPIEGANWGGNDNDNTSLRDSSARQLEPNKWIKCWFRYTNNSPDNTNFLDLFDNSNFGVINNTGQEMTYKIRNIKGELGNKPTDWSPCPYDVQTDIGQVQNNLNNLQIGGRNLLLNSGFTNGFKYFNTHACTNVSVVDEPTAKSKKSVTFTSTGGGIYQRNAGVALNAPAYLEGTKLIVSGYFKCTSTATFTVGLEGTLTKQIRPSASNTWTYFEVAVVANGTSNTFIFYGVNGNTYHLKDLKLETGNKATDWTPAPEDVQANIDGIQVGGRNLVLGSNDYSKYAYDGGKISVNNVNGYIEIKKLTGVEQWNTGAWIDVNAQPNTEYTLSFKVGDSTNAFVGIGGFGGTSECNHSKYGYHDYPANQKFIHTFTTKSDENKIRLFFALKANSPQGAYTRIKELKLEHGNKATDWSPAPEDIDESISGKVDVGGSIDDVNQSAGQIEYPKLKIKGAISFEDLNSENIGNNFVPQRDSNGNVTSTLINGATIVAGSITGDLIKAYQLVVTRRKLEGGKWVDTTIPTFSISQEGLIQASGTFKSFNFKGDESNLSNSTEGWIITNNGQSVFNDSIIRGRVELPSAGMTNYGGIGNYNLLPGSETNNLNYLSNHVGSNSISTIKIIDESDAPYGKAFKVVKTNNGNIENASGGRYFKMPYKLEVGKVYSWGVYVKGTAGVVIKIGCEQGGTKSVTLTDEYQYVTNTFAATDSQFYQFVFYADKAVSYCFHSIKLEEGNKSTPWTPLKGEEGNLVRYWAGTEFKNRNSAPFKVLHNGTIIATRGEFGGTFTGRLEIGNISIYDDNTSYGIIDIKNNDNSKSIVRIGEDYSMFKSDVFFGDKDNYMFKTNLVNKQLVSGKQSSIRFEYERNEGDDGIFASSITISGHKIQFNENEFMKLIHNNTIQIGSSSPKSKLMLKSSHDSEVDGVLGEVDLEVHGNIKTYDTLSIGNVDMVAVYPGGGIDFFIN